MSSTTTGTVPIAVLDLVSWADQRDERARCRYEVKEVYAALGTAVICLPGEIGPCWHVPLRWLIRVGGPREAITP